MKYLILPILFILLSTATYSQDQRYYHELRGMEDSTGTSQLFYREYIRYDRESTECGYNWTNHIYHFNTMSSVSIDSILFKGYYQETTCTECENSYSNTSDFLFLNNNLSQIISANRITGMYGNTSGLVDSYNDTFFDAGWTTPTHLNVITTDSTSYSIIGINDDFDSKQRTLIVRMDNDSLPSVSYPRTLLTKKHPASNNSECFDQSFYCHESDSLKILEYSFMGVDNSDSNRLYLQRNDSLFTSINLGDSVTFLNDEHAWSSFGELTFGNDAFQIFASTNPEFITNTSKTNFSTYTLLQSTNSGTHWQEIHTDTSRIFQSNLDTLKTTRDFYVAAGNTLFYWNQLANRLSPLSDIEIDSPITGLYAKPGNEILYILTKSGLHQFDTQTQDLITLKQILSSNENEPEIPNQLILHQNYPNPFNPSTAISYELSANSHVRLKVFDLLGREIAELVNTQQAAGPHEVTFDASTLSSGMYLYRIEANGTVQTKRFTLIK